MIDISFVGELAVVVDAFVSMHPLVCSPTWNCTNKDRQRERDDDDGAKKKGVSNEVVM
jgi:hypothetical protein